MTVSIKAPGKGFVQTSARRSDEGLGYLQVVLVVCEERLRALGPQCLHGVLALACVVPLNEAHEALVGLAGLLLVGLVFFNDAHDVGDLRLPATLGQGESGLLRNFRPVGGMALAAATPLARTWGRRVESFGSCALLRAALLLALGLWCASNVGVVLLQFLGCGFAMQHVSRVAKSLDSTCTHRLAAGSQVMSASSS
jgi:hypothetical protein